MKRTLAIALLATLAPMTLAAAGACTAPPLNILLTNDDGYDTIGIVALHRTLKNAGHHVKRIAPDRNYSGSSASMTFDLIKAPQVPNAEFTEIFAVSGSPATTVLLGASAIFSPEQPAQLVISGINNGANLGPATPISGTVGAAIAAIRVLNPPLQAIKGVRLADQGQSSYFKIGFTATGDGHFVPSFGEARPAKDLPLADTALFNEGYITVVPIDGDYTASGASLPINMEVLAP